MAAVAATRALCARGQPTVAGAAAKRKEILRMFDTHVEPRRASRASVDDWHGGDRAPCGPARATGERRHAARARCERGAPDARRAARRRHAAPPRRPSGTLALAGLVGVDRAARARRGRGADEPAADVSARCRTTSRPGSPGRCTRSASRALERRARWRSCVAFCACYAVALRYAAAISARRLWTRDRARAPRRRCSRRRCSPATSSATSASRASTSLHGLSPYAFTRDRGAARRDPPAARLDDRDDALRPAVHAPERGARAARDRRRRCGRSRRSPR